MPLYDYDCAACRTRFEVVHGVHAEPPTSCPVCGGGPIKKAFAPPTIHFKGTGWAKKERRAAASNASKEAAPESASTPSDPGGSSSDGSSSDGSSASEKGRDTSEKGRDNGPREAAPTPKDRASTDVPRAIPSTSGAPSD